MVVQSELPPEVASLLSDGLEEASRLTRLAVEAGPASLSKEWDDENGTEFMFRVDVTYVFVQGSHRRGVITLRTLEAMLRDKGSFVFQGVTQDDDLRWVAHEVDRA